MSKAANKRSLPRVAIQRVLDLDRLVHEPARLLLLTLLANAEEIEFRFFETATGLTRGNLSSHLLRLEQGRYLTALKAFRGRIPVTSFRITSLGRKALAAYRSELRQALDN